MVLAVVVSSMLLLSGCVEREWTLRTEPAGAIAVVSGVEIGRTPVTIDLTWVGDYEVTFRKEAYSLSCKPDWPMSS